MYPYPVYGFVCVLIEPCFKDVRSHTDIAYVKLLTIRLNQSVHNYLPSPSPDMVCATNRVTYVSLCHMQKDACEAVIDTHIEAETIGKPCPSGGGTSRSTLFPLL